MKLVARDGLWIRFNVHADKDLKVRMAPSSGSLG